MTKLEFLNQKLSVSQGRAGIALVLLTFFPITIMIDAFSYAYYIVGLVVLTTICLLLCIRFIRKYTINYKSFVWVTIVWIAVRFTLNSLDVDLPVVVDEGQFLFSFGVFIGAAAYYILGRYIIYDKKVNNELR